MTVLSIAVNARDRTARTARRARGRRLGPVSS
jgi:hypothetical protein